MIDLNICLKISYLGSNYFGFQKQPDKITIQGVLETTFLNIFHREIKLIGCSRTDAGVHAKEFYCNFHIENFFVPYKNIKNAMNVHLHYDIRILDCYEVSEDFHSRYFAKKKEYEYKIFNGEVLSPFKYLDHMHFKFPLDFNKMSYACKYFEGTHDFKSFTSKGSSVKTTIRTIFKSELYKEEDVIIYKVLGDGFLYNMVRIIVGTLIMVGQGRIKESDILSIIKSKERGKAGFVADSKGLCLKKVFYDN